jgi:type III restriction enzyme
VLRDVRNDHLGFEVPYEYAGQEHRYRRDFTAVLDDGNGPDDPLHLVLEVKGEPDGMDAAKHDTMRRRWAPAVNADGRFKRWSFRRPDGPHEAGRAIDQYLADRDVLVEW